mmetsp:Transcript_61/g.217  ORF Transcript_61/g.217 Transcript_61/m.217 type:complete len:244 (-) Transcript_61:633-1364(-)
MGIRRVPRAPTGLGLPSGATVGAACTSRVSVGGLRPRESEERSRATISTFSTQPDSEMPRSRSRSLSSLTVSSSKGTGSSGTSLGSPDGAGISVRLSASGSAGSKRPGGSKRSAARRGGSWKTPEAAASCDAVPVAAAALPTSSSVAPVCCNARHTTAPVDTNQPQATTWAAPCSAAVIVRRPASRCLSKDTWTSSSSSSNLCCERLSFSSFRASRWSCSALAPRPCCSRSWFSSRSPWSFRR